MVCFGPVLVYTGSGPQSALLCQRAIGLIARVCVCVCVCVCVWGAVLCRRCAQCSRCQLRRSTQLQVPLQ